MTKYRTLVTVVEALQTNVLQSTTILYSINQHVFERNCTIIERKCFYWTKLSYTEDFGIWPSANINMCLCSAPVYKSFCELCMNFYTCQIHYRAIKCGSKEVCHTSENWFIVIYGIVQIVLSQIPNFNKLAYLSLIAAAMSFAYSFIGAALSMTKLIQGN